jgi:hypothetical protein
VLGWTHSHRLCVKCLPKMRMKIEAKVSYNPSLKVKGDKELAGNFFFVICLLFCC